VTRWNLPLFSLPPLFLSSMAVQGPPSLSSRRNVFNVPQNRSRPSGYQFFFFTMPLLGTPLFGFPILFSYGAGVFLLFDFLEATLTMIGDHVFSPSVSFIFSFFLFFFFFLVWVNFSYVPNFRFRSLIKISSSNYPPPPTPPPPPPPPLPPPLPPPPPPLRPSFSIDRKSPLVLSPLFSTKPTFSIFPASLGSVFFTSISSCYGRSDPPPPLTSPGSLTFRQSVWAFIFPSGSPWVLIIFLVSAPV